MNMGESVSFQQMKAQLIARENINPNQIWERFKS